MSLSLFTSKTTWAIIAMFIIGGLEAVNIIPTGVGEAILGILGISGMVAHATQIKAGSIR